MVENLVEVKVPSKNEAVYVVRARKQGTDLGYLTKEKYSGPELVCFVQKGFGNEYTYFHYVFFHGGCLERMYEAGRTESSMGRDFSE